MDYKKLIKSRNMRVKIMQALSFIPDRPMLKLQYRLKTGHRLNLKNPKRFTEKLQWYKLYYRDPLMAQCADKYDVRSYVEHCGLGDILNQLYGVYDSPEEINFDKLPKSFVLKDTLGGGGNAVLLVKDKSKLNESAVRSQMMEWVNEPVHKKHPGREWVYDRNKHRIVAEEIILSNTNGGGIIDYKFFCFQGKVEILYVVKDHKMGFYDAQFNPLLVYRIDCIKDYPVLKEKVDKPQNYEEMIAIANKLSRNFPHVRVDLYNVEGKIIFGELTFFSGSGYMTFEPDEFDFVIGEKFNIKKYFDRHFNN